MYLITTDILGPSNAPWEISQFGYVGGILTYMCMGIMVARLLECPEAQVNKQLGILRWMANLENVLGVRIRQLSYENLW